MYALVIALFFGMTAFKDFSQNNIFYLIRGIVCLVIAATVILGRQAGF